MKKIFLLLALFCHSALAADTEREYRIAQIVVDSEKKAVEIIRKLKSGADFGQLARENSLDILSRSAGGDLGWFSSKELDTDTGEMLKKMRSGDFSSAPVKNDSSWNIFQVSRTREGAETFMHDYSIDDLPRLLGQSSADRKEIQSLKASFKFPPFAVMPAVTAASVPAPAGADDYNSAYKTNTGCIFFYEKTARTAATHADWKGPACKGNALSGKGVLRITAKIVTEDGGENLVQHEMRGTFANGMLSGVGEKTNIHYKADKTPIHDSYHFYGMFAHGFLSGQGQRTWIGAPADRPSAVQLTGTFVAGLPNGLLRQVRSQPYEGAVGDVITLAFGPKGTPYIEQAQVQRGRPVEGTIYFDDDEWTMYVQSWNYRAPVAAVFVRAPDYRKYPNQKSYLLAQCMDWRFETAGWDCKDGTIRHLPAGTAFFFHAEQAAFSLAMQAGAQGLNVSSDPAVYLLGTELDKNRALRCNPDWSECSDQAEIEMAGPYTWRGDVRYLNGEIKPVGAGAVLAYRGEDFVAAKREVVAECHRLSSPTECESGTYKFSNGGTFEGPFRLKNATYGLQPDSPLYGPRPGPRVPRYGSEGEVDIELHGWGRITFSNGSWADVRKVGGTTVEVGDCEDPASDEALTCTLDGKTIVFNAPRRSSSREEYSSARQQERSWEPQRAPKRFVPTPIPGRQTYMLPGMR